ncbi:hypothetical protein NDU88_004645 [Pleurodeles waltl]|uniref:Uncharacterized protein n=1 Tax=Pleurodeles waltl TaxID=8319 RepID=A0AAV7PD41_PLEWA|nr:hypothetical protein NDU88_004645 [Pleurodeles waltl]
MLTIRRCQVADHQINTWVSRLDNCSSRKLCEVPRPHPLHPKSTRPLTPASWRIPAGCNHGPYPAGDLSGGQQDRGMDSMMASLTEDTRSMRLDITGFQSRVTALEQRMTTVETHWSFKEHTDWAPNVTMEPTTHDLS